MTFQNQKKTFLEKDDKSNRGEIDKHIKQLVDLINQKENYYTTSSCSGRIVLLKQAERKDQADQLFVSHEPIETLNLDNLSEEVWFKEEGLILHVCCKTNEDAEKLLNIVRDLGLKRSGIISTSKCIVEILSSDKIDCPIYKDKLLVSEDYLKFLIESANKKLEKNFLKIKELENKIKKL